MPQHDATATYVEASRRRHARHRNDGSTPQIRLSFDLDKIAGNRRNADNRRIDDDMWLAFRRLASVRQLIARSRSNCKSPSIGGQPSDDWWANSTNSFLQDGRVTPSADHHATFGLKVSVE